MSNRPIPATMADCGLAIELDDDKEVQRALQRIARGPRRSLARHARHRRPPRRPRRGSLQDPSLAPGGMPWPAPKPATERARKRSGHVPITILQRSFALVRAHPRRHWSPAQGVAGTNLVYAATHQFGDPERNILARPFLGASGEDNRFIVDTRARHIDPDLTPHNSAKSVVYQLVVTRVFPARAGMNRPYPVNP